MALTVGVRSLDGLEGKSDRVLKVTFRGNTQTSAVVPSLGPGCYLGEQFTWPIGRPLDMADTLEIRAYNHSKYLSNKLIGSLTISLQHLAETGCLDLREHLIDSNHSTTKVTVDIEVSYNSPDSRIGDWHQEDFDYPGDLPAESEAGDADAIDSFSLADAQSLLDGDDGYPALATGPGDEEVMDNMGDDASSLGNVMRKTLGVPAALDPTLDKLEDFQLSVTIIEARQLSGANINPCVEVRVGEQSKRTEIQMSTNSPYYNQYFVFELHTTRAELLDHVIHIRAVNKGSMLISRLFSGDLIGDFRLDVRTVYSAPGCLACNTRLRWHGPAHGASSRPRASSGPQQQTS